MSNKPLVGNVLRQAAVIMALTFSILTIAFVMVLGFLGDDETLEREDLRKAMQELHYMRKK